MQAFISNENFKNHIANDHSHPLHSCPPEEVEHFCNSLKFSNGKLVHAEYGNLKKYMITSDFEELWASLGVDMERFALLDHSTCINNTGCSFHPSSFCDPEYCHP